MEKTTSNINKWGLGLEYADSTKYKMEKGDPISKYEIWEEIKKAFEEGFDKAKELYKIKD
jgi:Pyruvate/2-oxoacid:ferredoxin oxidoreductase gamma subunit